MKTSRRRFMQQAAVVGLTAGAFPVSRSLSATDTQPGTRTFPGLDAFKARLKALPRRSGLKVTSIETFTCNGNLSFVRVKASDGSEGYGQISPYDADISATVLHRKIARHVLGADPYDFEAISDRCIEANYKFPWSYVCRALCGVDTALWDLRGKREGKSVCELLGGQPRPFPVYGSSMSRTIKPADEAARLARLRERFGYRAFKIRIGRVCGHDRDQWPGRTEAIVPAVRRAIGEDCALLVDANSCYTPPKAIEVARQVLAPNRVCHLEEPCPYWELEWTAEVTAAIDVPVAGGEQDNDLAQWRRMIRMHAVDIVQPDICYIGGLTRALRVAIHAAEAGLPCVPHSANLSMVTVFTLHMMGAIPNAGNYVEFSIEKTPWVEGIYHPALEVRDGKVPIPAGPGWGVTIPQAVLDKAERQTSA